MIYTLTTNPAIDMNVCTNGLEPSRVNRTFGVVYTPNGKGLNVSFVLGHFGVESVIKVDPVWVDDTTRINIFLNDGEKEYKFVNEGSFVTEENQFQLLKMIKEARDMDYLSISGSLAKGINTAYYDQILEVCQQKNVDVILDISSPKLAELLKYKPLLIKPNDEELKDIFGIDLKTEKDMINALDFLHKEGAQNILLTLGDKGSYFYNGKNVYYASAQPVKLLSSACAGDSALAAFLSVWLDDQTKIVEALKNSAATGANVAESNAIGTLEKVEEYKKNIQVRKVR